MFIQTFPSGPFSTNAYVVACPITKEAAIIDPAPNSAKAICKLLDEKEFRANKILITHSHWDHIAETSLLKARLQIPVYIHPLDIGNLEEPGSDQLPCWIPIQGVKADYLIEEGDEIKIGALIFKVIHTPGHTPGGVCFYSVEEHVLFSGDTLFQGTIGNLSFPTSQPELMWKSLSKLSQLPPQTNVYPGHGPETTIGKESWLSQAQRLFG
jgi:hydroxyacylglutathione hydrolase